MSCGVSSRPAGRPSMTAVRPGPWDSPAVVKRNGMPCRTLLAALLDRDAPVVAAGLARGVVGVDAVAALAVRDAGHLEVVGLRVVEAGDGEDVGLAGAVARR